MSQDVSGTVSDESVEFSGRTVVLEGDGILGRALLVTSEELAAALLRTEVFREFRELVRR